MRYFFLTQNTFQEPKNDMLHVSVFCRCICQMVLKKFLKPYHCYHFGLRPCHTLPDSANGRVTDNKILCPFVSVRMRSLSLPHAVNAFRVR